MRGRGLETGREQGRDSVWVSSPRSHHFFGAWRPLLGMLLGTTGPLHSLDCFLDFEEPLDDFLGFFIRWYFRASSLSGAAASPDGDGRFLGRKSRQAPSAALGHARSLWMSPAGDRSTPASSAVEKEMVRTPGRGSWASQMCWSEAPERVPCCPLTSPTHRQVVPQARPDPPAPSNA